MADEAIDRKDLIGKKGLITKKVEIILAEEYINGISVLVRDSKGREYWTDLEDIKLD